MAKLFLSVAAIILVTTNSCSSRTAQNALPEAPASVKAVKDEVKGKKYKVGKAGTHSLISTDKEIQWLEPKKEDAFEKEIADESKSLQLDFMNDTLVTVLVKDKTYKGTYAVDDIVKEDEKPGIKIRISYVDEEFKFGDGPASLVTYTYIVEGISDKSLLLETPRSMNRRKIVVLMNRQ
jgi:hypothetical protein